MTDTMAEAESEGGAQPPSWPVATAAAAITVVAVLWALGVFWRMGYAVYTEQPLAAMLGLGLFIVFLTRNWGGHKIARPGWSGIALAVLSLAVCAYIAYDYPRLAQDIYHNPVETFIVGGVVGLLALEGVRRASGWPLVIVFGLFFAYALLGHLAPGVLQGRSVSVYRLAPILGLDSTALFGTPLAVVGTIVIAFMLMGQLLFVTGGGEFFTDLAKSLTGRQRGGAAKIAVLASGFFGSISGSVVANVTSTGIITIPMMKRTGFKPHVAGAIEAVASNGGQLMPPVMGAAAFLMADFLGIGYGDVILAALIPAILYFFAVFLLIDFEAAREKIASPVDAMMPKARAVLKQGWFFCVPFAVLLVLMFRYNLNPETAALAAAATIFVFGLFRGYAGNRIGPSAIWHALVTTGMTSVQILVICGVAGMIIGIINVTGLAFSIGLVLTQIGGTSLFLLLLVTGFICILLGMSMPTTSLYILLSTLVVPSLIDLGAMPIAAHFFVLYFGIMSFVTPPVAFAAFAAANIADASPMRTGWTAMRFGWVAYIVPFVFIYSPSLLMQGDLLHIVVSSATAAMGVTYVSAAMMGYFRSALTPAKRVVAVLVGACLLVPSDALPFGVALNVVTLAIAVLLMAAEARRPAEAETQITDKAVLE
tara:strand:- start:108 stop:2060 length:1953 start_codon:yes stop_codon:yes gene_type:complete